MDPNIVRVRRPARGPVPTTDQQREALELLARVIRGEGEGVMRLRGGRVAFALRPPEQHKTTV